AQPAHELVQRPHPADRAMTSPPTSALATKLPDQQPPSPTHGATGWLRTQLFASFWSTAITLALGYLAVRGTLGFFEWAVFNAVWTVPGAAQPDTTACHNASGVGACWAVIAEKYRLILFGRYPFAEQWRPALCVALFCTLYGVSAMRRFWRWEL